MYFKIAAVSENMNNFGLHQVVFVAEDGTAIVGLKTHQFIPKKGDTVDFLEPFTQSLSENGYECPKTIDKAPPGVVAEIWK